MSYEDGTNQRQGKRKTSHSGKKSVGRRKREGDGDVVKAPPTPASASSSEENDDDLDQNEAREEDDHSQEEDEQEQEPEKMKPRPKRSKLAKGDTPMMQIRHVLSLPWRPGQDAPSLLHLSHDLVRSHILCFLSTRDLLSWRLVSLFCQVRAAGWFPVHSSHNVPVSLFFRKTRSGC
jgi:hypothetical protein